MDFATKIFCSMLFAVTLVCMVVTITIYMFYKKDIKQEFVNRYQTYGNTISSTFHYLEIGSDLANKNAVYLLSEIEARNGVPSDQELDRLAKSFGVNGFYVISKKGKFIRSSDLPIKQQINSLFSYNKDYQLLINGNAKISITPIIPSYPYDIPAKLTMIPNKDKTLILESSTHLEYISKILHQIIATDKNIKSVGLYAPTGYELGSVSSLGKFHQGRRNTINDLSLTNKLTNNMFVFSIKIPTIMENCPECVQKGVSINGKYYYILRIEVSLLPFYKRLDTLKSAMILIFITILIVSIILSKIISKKLVSRIEKITATANDIIRHRNLSLQVAIKGNDEISHLASTFNAMIKALKDSQEILIETEKIRSVANISIQLAHDIRSPLAIMEGMIRRPNNNQAESAILKEAVQSVRDIANNLLTNYRNSNKKNDSERIKLLNSLEHICTSRPTQLSFLIESIVSQKRQEWSNHPCDLSFTIETSHLKFIWINVVPNEIKRMLSNLLNNSYEALQRIRKITIILNKFNEHFLELHILDKGHGIEPDKINDVLSGVSLKHGGKGLGLSSARQQMKKIGGSLF